MCTRVAYYWTVAWCNSSMLLFNRKQMILVAQFFSSQLSSPVCSLILHVISERVNWGISLNSNDSNNWLLVCEFGAKYSFQVLLIHSRLVGQINSLRDNGTPYMGIHFINLFLQYWCYNAHSDWWGVNTVIFAVLIAYQVEEWLLLALHLHLLLARVAPNSTEI